MRIASQAATIITFADSARNILIRYYGSGTTAGVDLLNKNILNISLIVILLFIIFILLSVAWPELLPKTCNSRLKMMTAGW
jgi:hypothetical protein